jgi:hypothetical protein
MTDLTTTIRDFLALPHEATADDLLALVYAHPEAALAAFPRVRLAGPWNVGTQTAERRCAVTGQSVALVSPDVGPAGSPRLVARYWWRVSEALVVDAHAGRTETLEQQQRRGRAWSGVRRRGHAATLDAAREAADDAVRGLGFVLVEVQRG